MFVRTHLVPTGSAPLTVAAIYSQVHLNGQNWRSALIGAALLSTKVTAPHHTVPTSRITHRSLAPQFFDDFSTRNNDFALALAEYTLSDINR